MIVKEINSSPHQLTWLQYQVMADLLETNMKITEKHLSSYITQ